MNVPDSIKILMLVPAQGTNVTITVTEPVDYAGIAGGTPLATTAITGSYSTGPGAVDGITQTLPGQSDLDITADGTANYYAVHNGSNTLYEVYDVDNPQILNNGGTVSVAAGLHTLRDVT
jgi:hypothetical protein